MPVSQRSNPAGLDYQRGAASLVVVMVLFFLMLLVAAYASRTLIFEQRTSTNQYRGTQASEAAEAGLEWALSMLNAEKFIDTSCAANAGPGNQTFRDAYLPANLAKQRPIPNFIEGQVPRVMAACVNDGAEANWDCSCPTAGDAQATATRAGSTAFLVELEMPDPPTELQSINAYGCSGMSTSQGGSSSCVRAPQEGYAIHSIKVALIPALRNPPTAALTAQGNVDLPTNRTRIASTTPTVGRAVEARGSVSVADMNTTIFSAPGTAPAGAIVQNNIALPAPAVPPATDSSAFFAAFAGISKEVYKSLSGVAIVQCAGDCSPGVQGKVDAGAQRILLTGTPSLSNVTLGTPDRPVLIVSENALTLVGAVNIRGVVYAPGLSWTGAGSATARISGALVIEGDCCAGIPDGSRPLFNYDADIIERLRISSGAYARVPGSWIDRKQ